MKKLLTLAVFALFAGGLWAASPMPKTANNPFQDDLSRLDQDFAGMTELEKLVETRNASYTQLAAEQNPLLSHVVSDRDIAASLLGSSAPDGDRLLGIPGFWWGFCLGFIGVILVYVATEGDARTTQGRQSMLGCLVGTLLSIGIYVLLLAAYANTP